MKEKSFISMLMVMLCLVHGNGVAGMTVIDGTGFENSIELQGNRLHLKGGAIFRYFIVVETYAGALYLPKDADGAQALEEIIKYLELEYRISIAAEDFAKATHAKIKDSVSAATYRRLYPKIESLNQLYKNVGPGDRYALAYIPGQGTQLILNSIPLGTIEGADFAKAMFGIWIGENPIDAAFRDKLLGKKK